MPRLTPITAKTELTTANHFGGMSSGIANVFEVALLSDGDKLPAHTT